MSAFEGRNLACSRAGRRIFAALDFTLPAGGALILRGANGSGKSSLLRILAGLLAPVGGELHWDGKAVKEDPEAFQDDICYVGHRNAIKPVLTVRENLAFWSKLYPPKPGQGHDELLDRALEIFTLTTLRDVPGRQLSSGQSRRLALARLITSPARIWLLDEPSVGLDDVSIKRLEAAIADHRTEGGLVIAATHTPLDIDDPGLLLLEDFAPPEIDPEFMENNW